MGGHLLVTTKIVYFSHINFSTWFTTDNKGAGGNRSDKSIFQQDKWSGDTLSSLICC